MKAITLIMVGVLVAGGTVLAEEGQKPKEQRPSPEERFKAADTDGNGTVSLEEFKVVHEKRLAAHKKRMGDRYDEERAAKMPSAEDIFKRLDNDTDGALTQEEMAAGHRRRGRGRPHKKPAPEEDAAPPADQN